MIANGAAHDTFSNHDYCLPGTAIPLAVRFLDQKRVSALPPPNLLLSMLRLLSARAKQLGNVAHVTAETWRAEGISMRFVQKTFQLGSRVKER
ncbi:hypothetical protein Y032_0050g1957 [Ancylostoma ceylanicum]|uniref:Uncharacterized protein n=1 Tax=Ancylostoma ceylanicum TaxID=53326 RepID=A0A016UAC2_9BILA|nr:hypothetical protein Y032_0050g1957 [Ancylostoma ceylanicum]